MRKNYFAKKFVAYSMAFAVACGTLTVSPVFVKEAKAATVVVSDMASSPKLINDGSIILSSIDSDNASVGISTGLSTLKNDLQLGSKKISLFTLKDTGNVVEDTVVPEYAFYIADDTTLFKTPDKTVNKTAPDPSAILIDGTENKNVTLTGVAGAGKWYKLNERKGTYTTTSGSTTAKVTYSYFEANLVKDCSTASGTNNYNFNGATELTSSDMGLYIYVTLNDNSTPANAADDYSVIEKFYNLAEKSDLEVKERKENTLVTLGSTAKLSVVATLSNKKELTYTWTKEGVDLNNDSDTLTVENVTKDKLGTYKCTVTDGVKTVATYPRLSVITASDLSVGVVGSAHTINTQVNVLNSNSDLPSGKATLTTSIPEGDYKYIWAFADDSKVTLSSKDTINYNASNRSVTFEYASTETTKLDDNSGDKNIKCYAIPTSTYETIFKNELENVKNYGLDDVSKFKYNGELRDQEVATHDFDGNGNITGDTTIFAPANDNVIYTETFSFEKTDSFTTSEAKNVKLGESVKLTGPTTLDTQTPGRVYEYIWSLPNGTTKVTTGKELVIDTVDVNDLGPIKCNVTECNKNHSDTTGNVCKDTTKTTAEAHNYGGKVLATKIYNMVYVSDLTATSSDVMAKATQKEINLAVTANSSLPITYEWGTRTHDGTSFGSFTQLGGTYDEKEYKYTNDSTFADFFTGNKNTSVLHVCKVSDGIKTIEVPVKVTEVSTYKIFENKSAIDAGIALADTQTINVSGLKDDKITLAPIVVAASEAIEKELTYQWKKDGVAFSTDKQITVDVTDATTVYSLTVTEGTNDTTVNYNVTKTTEDVLKGLTLTDIRTIDYESNVVYTGKEINPINAVVARVSTNTGNDTPNVTYEFNYTLKEGVDYTVELIDAVNAGVSMFKINFIGNFAELYKNVPADGQKKGPFTITRAENKVEIGDNAVVYGQAILPKIVTNLGKGALTYTYYADADATTEIAAPTKVGTYYVKATANATINYNEAESNVAKVVVAPGTTKIGNTSRSASAIKLNWSKVAGANKYRVYIKKSGKWTKVADTTALSYTVKGLASATTYQFAVKAFAGSIASPKYVTRQTTTAPAKVATPAVTAKGSGKVAVSYGKVTRATGYQVYMAKGNGSYKKVAQGKLTAITKSKLTKGATYKFKVRAYKKVGSNVYYGAFSSAKAVKVK